MQSIALFTTKNIYWTDLIRAFGARVEVGYARIPGVLLTLHPGLWLDVRFADALYMFTPTTFDLRIHRDAPKGTEIQPPGGLIVSNVMNSIICWCFR